MARTLLPTSPPMRGNDVKAVQRRLGVEVDGVYGPKTANAVRAWRHRTGFPRALPGLGPWGQKVLAGTIPLPGDYRKRAGERARTSAAALTVPERAVRIMEHWAALRLIERPVTLRERRRGLTQSNDVPQLGDVATNVGLSSWYAAMGWPWCAFATFLSGKVADGVSAALGFSGKFNVLYCPDIYENARRGRHGLRVVSEPMRGDLCLFNWDGGVVDHIGRVVSVGGGTITTVEGNTSSDDGGSQNNGGGMYVRHRRRSLIVAYLRDS